MPFVKLDCGILESSLWIERDVRDVFITALLLARPHQLKTPQPQLHIRSLKPTGWVLPAGEYGFVKAASTGIIDRAKVPVSAGLKALETLGAPEVESRSSAFDGRRIVRVDGGFVVLNYMRYRGQDRTNAERQARYRTSNARNAVTPVTGPLLVTQAEEDLDLSNSKIQTQREILPSRRKDQDHRASRDSYSLVVDDNPKLLTKFAFTIVRQHPDHPVSEWAELLKDRAAKARVAYTPDAIRKALTAAEEATRRKLRA